MSPDCCSWRQGESVHQQLRYGVLTLPRPLCKLLADAYGICPRLGEVNMLMYVLSGGSIPSVLGPVHT